jgi:hypothetical protein
MKKILVPVDFNPLATAALRHAAELAQCEGATLIVMYADPFEPPAEFTIGQTAALARSMHVERGGFSSRSILWQAQWGFARSSSFRPG